VLARDPAAARARLDSHLEIIPGDLTRKRTLVPAFAGVTHVIFTAGVRSGRFARGSLVRATEYQGVLDSIEAACAQDLRGRLVYMTSIGVRRRSLLASGLNLWKGNTMVWRRGAEEAIRSSGLDYAIVRAAILIDRPADRRAICVRQTESALTLRECVARADVAEGLVAAVYEPCASRVTFEPKWDRGPRRRSWPELLRGLRPDEPQP
jgi:uncharacterized protein YbjT (DUF2867 family)